MKKLFFYYSLSGNGEAVAKVFQAHGFEIRPVEMQKPMPRSFFFRILKGGFEAGIGKKAKLKEYDRSAADYDEIVVGSPIWNGRLSTPLNTLLSEVDFSGKKVSFVLYSGSGAAPKAEKRLAEEFPGADVIHLKDPKDHPDEIEKLFLKG